MTLNMTPEEMQREIEALQEQVDALATGHTFPMTVFSATGETRYVLVREAGGNLAVVDADTATSSDWSDA